MRQNAEQERRRRAQARRRRTASQKHRDLQGVKRDKTAGRSQNEYADRDDVDIFGAPIDADGNLV